MAKFVFKNGKLIPLEDITNNIINPPQQKEKFVFKNGKLIPLQVQTQQQPTAPKFTPSGMASTAPTINATNLSQMSLRQREEAKISTMRTAEGLRNVGRVGEAAIALADLPRNAVAGFYQAIRDANSASERKGIAATWSAFRQNLIKGRGVGDVFEDDLKKIVGDKATVWVAGGLNILADPVIMSVSKWSQLLKQGAKKVGIIAETKTGGIVAKQAETMAEGIQGAFRKAEGAVGPKGFPLREYPAGMASGRAAGIIEKEGTKQLARTGAVVSKTAVSEFHQTQGKLDKAFDLSQKIDYSRLPKPEADKVLFGRITQALKDVKPLTEKQRNLLSLGRRERLGKALAMGEKVSGESGFKIEKAALSGEFEKVEFESIRKNFSQGDVDRLFDVIKDSPALRGYEKYGARQGLARMLGEEGGLLPREGELALLSKVFPPDVITALNKTQGWFARAKKMGADIINVPRSMMSSFDLSAPFRQGLFMSTRKEFWKSFKPMFKSFGSDKAYKALNESITTHPNFKLMEESGLALTNILPTIGREEKFATQLAEKIPGLGIGIKASSRAYSGFLNKLRADVFNDLVSKAEKVGLDPKQNVKLLKDISYLINAGTGRGHIRFSGDAAKVINGVFFSPRLMSSRMTLLNPYTYLSPKLDPFVRKQALRDLFAVSVAVASVNALANVAGAKITVDPRNADFGKIKIGNTRIDVMGGFQQYIRAVAQIGTGETISSTTGKEYTLGEGYKPQTSLDIIAKNLEYKESPVASFFTTIARGSSPFNEEITIPGEVLKRLTPLFVQDVWELWHDDPTSVPLALVGALGFGVQTYVEKSPREIALQRGEKKRQEVLKLEPTSLEERRKKFQEFQRKEANK